MLKFPPIFKITEIYKKLFHLEKGDQVIYGNTVEDKQSWSVLIGQLLTVPILRQS